MNRKKTVIPEIQMLAKIMILFSLFFTSGCFKEDNITKPVEIEEIVYYQPASNDTGLLPKYAIKAGHISVITYEQADLNNDSVSCIFYYDKTEKQARYLVFTPNKMTQYIISSQNEFDKYVFEAEIIDSLICIREYEYNWNNDSITVLGEYYYQNSNEASSGYIQLRSTESQNNSPEQVAQYWVILIWEQIKDFYKRAGKVHEAIGGKWGKTHGEAFKSLGETLDYAGKIQYNEILPDEEKTKITITSEIEEFWEKTANFLNGMKVCIIDICKNVYKTYLEKPSETIKKFANNFTLSTYKMNFPKEGGSCAFTINTNLKVTNISSTQRWCNLSVNQKTVAVTVNNNETGKSRIATVFVDAIDENTNEKKGRAVLINQDYKDGGAKWGFTISQMQSGNCTNYGDVYIVVYDYIGNLPVNGFSTQQECELIRSLFSGISETYGNCRLYIHCTECVLQ